MRKIMKNIIGAILMLGICGGTLVAKDSPSALETFNALAADHGAVAAALPAARPTPVFTDNKKGFSRQFNPIMEACRGERSCFMALDGVDRQLCETYKEDKSCFMALDGADRGWCQVMKEGKSCFMALDGADEDLCEQGRYPRKHLFWARCGNIDIDHGQSNPVMQACRGERSCFMALDGLDQKFCQAYKENKSCFMALDGADRGWCEVLKEGKSCFMALDGADRERCERGHFPGDHLF
ncbi:MAG: hypothetical protein A2016_10935, partial [Elusimicrobia bacterium GWF2_62_30]